MSSSDLPASSSVYTSATTSAPTASAKNGSEHCDEGNDPAEDSNSFDDYDEEGKLVIDLGNDGNDVDKSNKEPVPTNSVPGPRNHNNNNSSAPPPSAGGKTSTSLPDKTQSTAAKTSSANPASSKTSSRSHSPSSTQQQTKNGKSKSKRSNKSPSSKQNSPPPNSSLCDATGVTKPNHSASGESSDDVSGKKNKSSKSNRSQHKKHKAEKNNGSNAGGKNDGEKPRSKSKQTVAAASGGSANTFVTSSTYSAPRAAAASPVMSSSSASSKTLAGGRHCELQASSLPGHSPGAKQAAVVGSGIHSRPLGRSVIGPCSVSAANKQLAGDQGPGGDGAANQSSRKKSRKGQLASVANSPAGADADAQRSCVPQPIKRHSSGQFGQDVSGPKKMRIDAETKRASGGAVSSHREVFRAGDTQQSDNKKSIVTSSVHSGISPERGETRFLKSPASSGCSTASNANPPVFAPSSLFTAFTPPRPNNGSAVSSSSTQTTSVWSTLNQESNAALVSQRSVGTLTSTNDVGVVTEPDCLGPCEPGTDIHLKGIVWYETDTGVLVVNVTWRNRTYIGTLLDSTKHDWAPPRFAESELEMELRGKNGRPKRPRNGASDVSLRKGRSRGAVAEDLKGSPSATAKKRAVKTSESELGELDVSYGVKPGNKRGRRNVTPQLQQLQSDRNSSNAGSESSGCPSPDLLSCPHPNCNKKYKTADALKYHQAHAHVENESGDVRDDVIDREASEESQEAASDVAIKSFPSAKNPNQPVAMETSSEPPVVAEMLSEGPNPPSASAAANSLAAARANPFTAASDYPGNRGNGPHDITHAGRAQPIEERRSKQDAPESYPASEPPPLPGASPSADRGADNGASESENAVAVRNLLLQLQFQDEPPLPAPYSQDSPAPTVSLISRSEPSSTLPTTQPPYRSEPSHPTFPRLTVSTDASVASYMEKVTDAMAARSVDDVVRTVASSQQCTGVTAMTSERDSRNVIYTSAAQTFADIGTGPGSLSTGLKTVKGKTVPVPVDSNPSLLAPPRGMVTSPSNINNSAKKVKRKKKTVAGEGAELVGHGPPPPLVKQERSTLVSANESVPPAPSIPSSAGAAAILNNMAVSYQSGQKLQQSTSKTGHDLAVPLSLAGHSPQVKVEPGMGLSTSQHIYAQNGVMSVGGRRVQGVVTPAATSSANHNVVVKGTYHPLPDPHKPQTAVSAQAQDRLRASRNSSPTNSSNRNNNNKLPGTRGQQEFGTSKPRLAGSNPQQEGSDLTRDYQNHRPRQGDYMMKGADPGVSELCAEDALSKMQDRCESTIIRTYANQRPQPPRSKDPTPLHESAKSSEPITVRSASPVEVPDEENRPQHLLQTPRPSSRAKEGVGEVQEVSPKPSDVAYHSNPAAAAFLPPHPVYGYAALGGYPFLPYDPAYQPLLDPRVRSQQWMQDYEKQQKLIQQQQEQALQQQQAEKRARKAAEERNAVKTESGKIPSHTPAETVADRTSAWVQQIPGKRPSTGSPPPLSVQRPQHRSHPQLPHTQQTRYKSPHQPSISPQAPVSGPVRSHSVAPSNQSMTGATQAYHHHARSESFERQRRSEVREEAKGHHVVHRPVSPLRSEARTPEKPKEPTPSFPAENPGTLQNFAAWPYAAYPPSRVPYHLPGGFVFPQTAGVFAQPPWPPVSQPPTAGKQSPPLKPSKEAPPVPTRSPRDEIRGDLKDRDMSLHYSLQKDRSRREAPTPRKDAGSPDLKQAPQPPRVPSGHPSEHKTSSPPPQRHLHTHHHIHEGVPTYNQFIPPQPYPYSAAIHHPPPAVIASEVANFPNTFHRKRE